MSKNNWPKEGQPSKDSLFGGGQKPDSAGKAQDATFRKPFPNFGKTVTGPEKG